MIMTTSTEFSAAKTQLHIETLHALVKSLLATNNEAGKFSGMKTYQSTSQALTRIIKEWEADQCQR